MVFAYIFTWFFMSWNFSFGVRIPFIKALRATKSSKSVTSKIAFWNFFRLVVTDSPSYCMMRSKWKLDFSCLLEATKWLTNLASSWVKVWMLPTGSEVYQIKATPLRVVGKNLHHKAWFVVYSSIRFLYATMCSSRHFVLSKRFMLGILILSGLGVVRISVEKREFTNIGASCGPPWLKSS